MNPSNDTDPQVGSTLLAIARSSLREAAGLSPSSWQKMDRLMGDGACFVTLRSAGNLRGCIGSVRPYRPLAEDVASNTRSAALLDPRFLPVKAEELDDIEIEVSLMSPMDRLAVESEDELLDVLRPGVDGLVMEYGASRGTFLPAVWREIIDPREFVTKLKIKAGLPADFWSPDIVLWRYTTTSYRESDLDQA